MVLDCKRFIADAMLGKLVKWLRVMGVDVEYDPHTPDHELFRFAVQEGRILLTRDHRLVQRREIPGRLLIESDYYHEQVRQVVQA
ncbi:MAG: Mut7-C RNAse domain-containing protein, partial [Candidatus Entotheonellia bacterium]